jgi:TetR/AcrR family transcriptional regulator, cholesterol catabolism regulator
MAITGTVPAVPSRPREADLMRAAIRLFRERGFHATSMQDLAEALGMNRGSLYHYIDSKDDLLWSIVSGALSQLDDHVRPILESPMSGRDRLRQAIAAHLAFAAAHADELSLVQIELRSLPPERRLAIVDRRDAYERLWRAAIEAALAEGTIRPTNVRLAGIAILSACNWFTQWYRPNGEMTLDDIAAQFADLFLAPPC